MVSFVQVGYKYRSSNPAVRSYSEQPPFKLPPISQRFAHSHHHEDFVNGRFVNTSSPSSESFLCYPIQMPFSGHIEPHPRQSTHFRPPIPIFHPGPPTQITMLWSQCGIYPRPQYGNNMVPHLNPYLEYPVGFDIYRNVSEPSHYVGHFVGNLAHNNCHPSFTISIHRLILRLLHLPINCYPSRLKHLSICLSPL